MERQMFNNNDIDPFKKRFPITDKYLDGEKTKLHTDETEEGWFGMSGKPRGRGEGEWKKILIFYEIPYTKQSEKKLHNS